MAAIPEAAGAGYAPCWVMRALLRALALGALLAAGWLLGSGTSHADEDPGLPGTDLINVVDAASSAEGAVVGSHTTRSAVTGVLSGASVPGLPVPSPVHLGPVYLGPLRSMMDSVGLPKPLANALVPVSRPLSSIAPHHAATSSPAPADLLAVPVRVSPATVAPATAANPAAHPRAAVRTAAFTPAPAGPAAHPEPLCAPAHLAVAPVIVRPAPSDGLPTDPGPASPPGSSTSACLLGGGAGGASAKDAPDGMAAAGSATTHRAQPAGLPARDTSDLPRSLAAEPSTSPD